jgi:hypothetical protein
VNVFVANLHKILVPNYLSVLILPLIKENAIPLALEMVI